MAIIHRSHADLLDFLEASAIRFNKPDFISSDPISIPHRFSVKEDIEISGFLTALISWGNRKSILTSADKMMVLMGNKPHDFVLNCGKGDLDKLRSFAHRTFNGEDLVVMIQCLQSIYQSTGKLEGLFSGKNLELSLCNFRRKFFGDLLPGRTKKHIADISMGSAAKRLNMFLRWMVRKDAAGVDFGIWDSISPSQLYIPLDVHSGRTARKLGLLERSTDDWKAVTELTARLREFDPSDPVKYDYALFGLSISGF